MLRWATCTDSCALLRFSRMPPADACVVSRWIFTSDSSRARRAEIADRVDGYLYASALDMRRRYRLRKRRRHTTPKGDAGGKQHDDGNGRVPDHFAAPSCSGSFRAIRSPSLTPDAMAI